MAEGHARRSDGVFLNHLRIALGSRAELSTEVEAAARLGFLKAESATALLAQIDQTGQMLHGLRRSIERRRTGLVSAVTVVSLSLWFGCFDCELNSLKPAPRAPRAAPDAPRTTPRAPPTAHPVCRTPHPSFLTRTDHTLISGRVSVPRCLDWRLRTPFLLPLSIGVRLEAQGL